MPSWLRGRSSDLQLPWFVLSCRRTEFGVFHGGPQVNWRVPSQPRSPGHEWARQLIYGADRARKTPLPTLKRLLVTYAEDALQALVRAIEEVEATASAPELHQLQDAVRDRLQLALGRLVAARDQLADRDVVRPFRVVLMGRTMAGKSTLFEYLSGGDGARVGDGRQRYSRDVCARPVDDLGIEIVDTPGVGAMDGQEDYEAAFGQVPEADMILWVATDQATQEQTGEALERLSDLGKPILVALNCLADVRDDIGLLDMLEEPERVFGGDAQGNLAPIRRHLSKAGGQYLDAVPIHAQAAQVSVSGELPDDQARTLHENSRIDTLTGAIRDQMDRTAELRRIVSVCDFLRVELLEVASALSDATMLARATLTASRGSQQDFHRRAQRRVEDAHDELKAAFATAVTSRDRWIERVDADQSAKAINLQWDQELETLREELERSATDIGQRLESDIKGIAVDVADDWSEVDTADFRNLGGRGALWGNRLVKVGGRFAVGAGVAWGSALLGAKIGALILTAGGPLGAAIGAVVGAVIGLVAAFLPISRGIDWLGDKVFRSPEDIHKRRRQRIRDQLSPRLNELREKLASVRAEAREDWLDAVENELARQVETSATIEQMLAVLEHTSADEIERAAAKVDAVLARELLRNLGRDRAASAVKRATRWRGAGLAVELAEPAFSELMLFPTDDAVERLLPTPEHGSATGSALQVIRSLTDREVTVRHMGPDRLSLTLGSALTSGAREAWEALAQAHTGVRVRISEAVEGDAQ